MSTFLSDMIESAAEQRQLLIEREMHKARLKGRLEAYAKAMTECWKSAQREGGVGARRCDEIHRAIDILHLATLKELMPWPASNTQVQPRAAECIATICSCYPPSLEPTDE